MANTAMGFGLALMILGLIGFLPNRAPTALIPAAVGIFIGVCGMIARDSARRMMAMHVAVTIGLLGLIGSGVMLIRALLRGTSPSGLALFSQIGMAVLCGLFVFLCVRSFIAARR